MPSKQRAVIARAWQRHLLSILTFHWPCRQTTLLTPESGTNFSSAQRRFESAPGQCAHALRRQAHCHDLARIGWTVRPQSVPIGMSGKEREEFPDLDNLRLELVSGSHVPIRIVHACTTCKLPIDLLWR